MPMQQVRSAALHMEQAVEEHPSDDDGVVKADEDCAEGRAVRPLGVRRLVADRRVHRAHEKHGKEERETCAFAVADADERSGRR